MVVLLNACTARPEATAGTAVAQPAATSMPGVTAAPAATPAPVLATPTGVTPDAATSAPARPSAAASSPAPAATEGALASGPLLQSRALLDALRGGGYVIFFRHAATNLDDKDTDVQNLQNCATQRNLNETGRADARAVGQAFQDLAIPVGRVLSSEFCRTLETARLAFGRVEPMPDLTSFGTAEDEAERERRVAALLTQLATPPAAGTNTVLVGHLFNFQAATHSALDEGEAAVFKPEDGRSTLVAQLQASEWADLSPD